MHANRVTVLSAIVSEGLGSLSVPVFIVALQVVLTMFSRLRQAVILLLLASAFLRASTRAAPPTPFDGAPWNISTGNLSVSYIQASPIGAFPKPDYHEP